jgi:Predicted membrane protein
MDTGDFAYTNTKKLVIFSMFSAIIFLLAFTPVGFINLGFIKATIIHIPVIIGSIILGAKMGAWLGFMFGMTSLINNTLSPAISSFVFSPLIPIPGSTNGSLWALLICFVPRILVGVLPWFIYHFGQRLIKEQTNFIALTIAGALGSMTNTLLVMHLIYFLFKDEYALARDVAQNAVYSVITTIIVSNGIPEAIVSGILTTAICKVLFVILRKQQL